MESMEVIWEARGVLLELLTARVWAEVKVRWFMTAGQVENGQ